MKSLRHVLLMWWFFSTYHSIAVGPFDTRLTCEWIRLGVVRGHTTPCWSDGR